MPSSLPILSGAPSRTGVSRRDQWDEPFAPPAGGDLIAALLVEQNTLTAVERFSQYHTETSRPLLANNYMALLPAAPPGPGQQYAFEVDLDRCSGCKACVTACHVMNGLDEGEAWRDVGLLSGGTPDAPVLQHVTTACHHCLDPACLSACPTEAYVKDAVTGIVKHLDDQCFGCQYCTLACPYDVPKFHKQKGIVRKCDLCSDRLAVGEAPACVQACPHGAIKVAVVDRQKVIEDSEANTFLPGAPNPDHTLPTTTFKSAKPFPRNLLPADYYDVKPEHAHWPLVIMLVLTQLSAGGFLAELVLHAGRPAAEYLHPLFSLAFGLLALAASTLHLGRPHLAHRAMLGLRHSWLSREAAAFGAFAPLAGIYAGLSWLQPDFYEQRPHLQQLLAGIVAAAGLAGVACGVMVYHVTRRAFWQAARGGVKFFGTAAILGISATLFTTHLAAALGHDADIIPGYTSVNSAQHHTGGTLCLALMAVVVAKLMFELMSFAHLRDAQFTSLRRTAVLMAGPLARVSYLRFGLAVLGGLIVPGLLLTADAGTPPGLVVTGSAVGFLCLLGGELAERYLFFTAVVRQKMPGGLTV